MSTTTSRTANPPDPVESPSRGWFPSWRSASAGRGSAEETDNDEPDRTFKDWVRLQRMRVFIVVLILIFVAAVLAPLIIVRIDSGRVGVRYWLFGGGTETDRIYQEGVQFIFPWDTMHLYNVRVQEIPHEVDLLTKNGLAVKFFLSIRYRPERELAGVLHKTVGPEYVDTIVRPQVTEVLRRNVGKMSAEELYTTKRAVLEEMFAEAIENLAQNYVVVDFIGIKTVELPKDVQLSIEDKIRQQHIAEAYEFRLLQAQKEAQRLSIEAGGIQTFNETVAQSLSADVLRWQGVRATEELAKSNNSKVIVIGNGDQGLPVILGAGK